MFPRWFPIAFLSTRVSCLLRHVRPVFVWSILKLCRNEHGTTVWDGWDASHPTFHTPGMVPPNFSYPWNGPTQLFLPLEWSHSTFHTPGTVPPNFLRHAVIFLS